MTGFQTDCQVAVVLVVVLVTDLFACAVDVTFHYLVLQFA
jgi:hypothetical protein